MATATTQGSGSTKNSGGTVFGGNTTRTNMNSKSPKDYGLNHGFVNKVSVGVSGTVAITSSVAVPYEHGEDTARELVIKHASETLQGVANTTLQTTGGSDQHSRPINKKPNTFNVDNTEVKIADGSWNSVSGTFDAGSPGVTAVTHPEDHAANPTKTRPSEITYKESAATPIQADTGPRHQQ